MLEVQDIIARHLDKKEFVLMYSTDLTAAFDLLHPGLLLDTVRGKLPYKICRILRDFLTERSFAVKVGSEISAEKPLRVGCAQGSTLGPKLFSIYCGGLGKVITENLVAYAYDAYVLVSGSDLTDVVERTKTVMSHHVAWLESIGIVVNVAKTESVLFSPLHVGPMEFIVKGVKVCTVDSMRVLGVEFDRQLTWNKHVDKIIVSGKRALQGLRVLRRNFSLNDFLAIMTAQFYSKIYYAAPVWLGCLPSHCLKRLESLHYSALRVECSDYRQLVGREILDNDFKRATPSEWGDYSQAREIIRIFNSGVPTCLYLPLETQSFVIQRPP